MKKVHGCMAAILLFGCGQAIAALEFSADISAGADAEANTNPYATFDGRLAQELNGFSFLWDVTATNDGKYGALFGGAFYGSTSILIREGGLRWSGGNFSLEAGKLTLRDEIDSPYSLAISSNENAALTAAFRYEDERFFFSNRWVALNYDSGESFGADGVEWPDRSAQLKFYGIKAGDFRFGFQDISVYTDLEYGSAQRGPLFDLDYFLNPAPGFFIQYAETSMDAPWRKSGALDDNSIMGFFGEWKGESFSADAQVLVDDINMNRFLNPSSYQNPDKIAWTIGGSMKTEYGTFRLDHAGATKYCFEPSTGAKYGNLCYGYTYYPSTVYLKNGSYAEIDNATNYVGYINGENNAALMASWKNSFGKLGASASLEFKLTGAQSPCNPWQQYYYWYEGGQGSHWLDDTVLEKRLTSTWKCDYALGDFTLYGSAKLGYAWNVLKLATIDGEAEDTIANGIPLYKPSSENALIAALTIGGRYSLKY